MVRLYLEARFSEPPQNFKSPGNLGVNLQELHHLIQLAESQGSDRIGATVIDGDAAGWRIVQGGAREGHIGYITHTLIVGLWRKQIGFATSNHFPRLVKV